MKIFGNSLTNTFIGYIGLYRLYRYRLYRIIPYRTNIVRKNIGYQTE